MLVLHGATLIAAVPEACMVAPRSGSDNTPTVAWSMSEAPTINPVVAELLYICALHSRKFYLNPSVFYYLGFKNCMADDDSCLFNISDTSLIVHIPATYP